MASAPLAVTERGNPTAVVTRARGHAFIWLTAVAAVAVFAAQGASAAVAQTVRSSGLAFEDARPWNLKWEELRKDAQSVQVCNVSGATARRPRSSVSKFVAGVADPVDVVTVELTGTADKTSGWQAGECRSVVLTRIPDTTVAGSSTGVVTVTSSVGIARRPVTIAGPVTVPTPATAKGATDVAAVKTERDGPFGEAGDSLLLLLRPATTDEKLTVPSDCNPSKSDGDAGCPFVGNVFNGTDVAKVVVAGPLDEKKPNEPASLKLRLENANQVGTYTGALDLAQTPADPADDVKLSVSVKDGVGWALAALILGGLISLGLQYGLRSSRPKKRLRDRYRVFESSYAAAVTEFNKCRPKAEGLDDDWQNPTAEDIQAITEAVEEGIKRYGASTVYWDATSDPYKELDRSLTLVEDDIACLADKERLPAKLAALETALEDLKKFLNESFLTPGAPPLVVPAAALLKAPRPALKVGQALTTTDAAQSATDLIATWLDLAEDVLVYESWWCRLRAKARASQDGPWTDDDVQRFRDSLSRIAEAKHELSTVADADDLAELGIAADLRLAYADLAYMSGLHDGWPSRDAGAPRVTSEDVELFALSPMTAAWATTRLDGVHVLENWLGRAGAVNSDAATTARLRDLGGVGIAALSLGFTVVAAVVTGLSAFYFGKDWGTTEDYLTVIVVAVAAQALVQSVVDAIGRLLPPAPKQLITGPAAAILKRPAPPATPVAVVAADPVGA